MIDRLEAIGRIVAGFANERFSTGIPALRNSLEKSLPANFEFLFVSNIVESPEEGLLDALGYSAEHVLVGITVFANRVDYQYMAARRIIGFKVTHETGHLKVEIERMPGLARWGIKMAVTPESAEAVRLIVDHLHLALRT